NLQDSGLDTVAANQELGFAADARDYSLAALILEDLGVRSVRLMTNNPAKIDGLRRHGIDVRDRVPIPPPVNDQNAGYLRTKATRLHHLLDPESLAPIQAPDRAVSDVLDGITTRRQAPTRRPFITLSWAQSIDGCIAAKPGQPLLLSGPPAMTLTHHLRAAHDAILVGIGTVLADNPRLNVRLVDGDDPRPVVLDSRLRLPLDARLLEMSPPLIAADHDADVDRQRALEAAGAEVVRLPSVAPGRLSLPHLLDELERRGIASLMVEGGAEVATSFLGARLTDHLVLTVAPTVVGGGLHAIGTPSDSPNALPKLDRPRFHQLGDDLIVTGDPIWS
ncbi:MAG: dihydrofolate reductase family protein, partial [Acidobacteriota bacterium]